MSDLVRNARLRNLAAAEAAGDTARADRLKALLGIKPDEAEPEKVAPVKKVAPARPAKPAKRAAKKTAKKS